MSAVKDVAIVSKDDAALLRQPQADPLMQMFERLATNPQVDVETLQRLIDMHAGIRRDNARMAFVAAFARMQADIPTIFERGRTDKTSYARYEDIQRVIRPILERHGFMLSHRTEFSDKTTVKVIGVLAHRDGHEERTEFVSAADTTGSKNAIQALGSTVQYGRRYTCNALLNISTSDERDDDGGQTSKPVPQAPKGFEDWWEDLQTTAENGLDELGATWKSSPKAFCEYLVKTNNGAWEQLKRDAAKVKRVE